MRLTPHKTPNGETIPRFSRLAAAELVENLGDGAVRCRACAHRCRITAGGAGICKMRTNYNGRLMVPWGYVAGFSADPIEKKPFFHVLPGAEALSFGMLGCNLHCSFCQNWITSQSMRDPSADTTIQEAAAENIVAVAVREGIPILTSTYNEPLITTEWAAEIFRLGREKGLRGSFVSNGAATPEALDFIRPYVDFFKVDLKCFRDENYRKLGAPLEAVTSTLAGLLQREFWVEVVTLLVPGFNDDPGELRELTQFLAGLSRDIPWHVTAFHPDYQMTARPRTQARAILEAAEIGKSSGLNFVYAGNLPGTVGRWENTYCPGCGALLIERSGFTIGVMRIAPDGLCPHCNRTIPGVWA